MITQAARAIAAIALTGLMAGGAVAQDGYPNKPIRLVVGLAPGGLADQTARLIGPGLSKELGQPIVIENRVGANGNIAARQVADSAPDGYTLMLVLDGTLVVGAALNPSTPFDPIKDFKPIVKLIETPLAVVAHPSLPAGNVADLLKLTTAPGAATYFYGTAGNGSSGHLTGEYLKQLTGIKMTHVPYKGAADAARDTVGGQVSMMISAIGTSFSFVEAGTLKVIAVTGDKRAPRLPNAPTAAESGLAALKSFNVQAWAGIVGPPGLPDAIVRKVYAAATKALSDPDLVEKFALVSSLPASASTEQFAKQIAVEAEQWRDVVRKADLLPNIWLRSLIPGRVRSTRARSSNHDPRRGHSGLALRVAPE